MGPIRPIGPVVVPVREDRRATDRPRRKPRSRLLPLPPARLRGCPEPGRPRAALRGAAAPLVAVLALGARPGRRLGRPATPRAAQLATPLAAAAGAPPHLRLR